MKKEFYLDIMGEMEKILSEELSRGIDRQILNTIRSMSSRKKDLKRRIEEYKNKNGDKKD
jgi:uncharacterized protein (UPF0335 family)